MPWLIVSLRYLGLLGFKVKLPTSDSKPLRVGEEAGKRLHRIRSS